MHDFAKYVCSKFIHLLLSVFVNAKKISFFSWRSSKVRYNVEYEDSYDDSADYEGDYDEEYEGEYEDEYGDEYTDEYGEYEDEYKEADPEKGLGPENSSLFEICWNTNWLTSILWLIEKQNQNSSSFDNSTFDR